MDGIQVSDGGAWGRAQRRKRQRGNDEKFSGRFAELPTAPLQ